MTKQKAILIGAALICINFVWVFGAAYLNDFHPKLNGFHAAFVVKTVINSIAILIWSLMTSNNWKDLK